MPPSNLQNHTPTARTPFLARVIRAYRALATGLGASLGFVVEQVRGFDGHVHDVRRGESEWEV